MLKFISITALLLVVMASVPLAGCGQPSATTPDATGTPVSNSAPTFGQYAKLGEPIYQQMAASCHGSNGQGGRAPALWGANAKLTRYNTAQGLLDFIATTMPFNAPGSLSKQEYQYVLSYLLVENNFVSSDTAFDAGQLGALQLK